MSEKNTATISLDKYVELYKIEEAYLRNQVVIYDDITCSRVLATANRDEKLADLAKKLSEVGRKYGLLLDENQHIYEIERQLRKDLDYARKRLDEQEKKPNAWQRFIKKYIA